MGVLDHVYGSTETSSPNDARECRGVRGSPLTHTPPTSNGLVESRRLFAGAHPMVAERGIRALSSDQGFRHGTTRSGRFRITPKEHRSGD